MAAPQLPDGFRWTWVGDTVRVDLPAMVRTTSHTYEPVLTRSDIEKVADAVVTYERARRQAGTGKVLKRIILARDPRYAALTLNNFRVRLSLALVERGQSPSMDEMVTVSGTDLDPEAGPA